MKWFLGLLVFTFAPIMASAAGAQLSDPQISRIKAYRLLVANIDPQPLAQAVAELERTRYPLVNLQIKEAMARAYADIVREQKVEGKSKQQWLYSMIKLNMAYLQFAGKAPGQDRDPLNQLIRQTLRTHLPPDIYGRPGFHTDLD
jgi:hypothetical protein